MVVMSFSSFQKENSPSVAFPVKPHAPRAARDFPNSPVSEDLVVRPGEPRVKLLVMTLKFVHQAAAVVGQVKRQTPSKARLSACRAVVPWINEPQTRANPELY